jgi:hypothetical protein
MFSTLQMKNTFLQNYDVKTRIYYSTALNIIDFSDKISFTFSFNNNNNNNNNNKNNNLTKNYFNDELYMLLLSN